MLPFLGVVGRVLWFSFKEQLGSLLYAHTQQRMIGSFVICVDIWSVGFDHF